MNLAILLISSAIVFTQAREHWWFSTNGINKNANVESTPSSAPENSNTHEFQQVQAILADSNDSNSDNETSTSTTTPSTVAVHQGPVIVASKREVHVENGNENTEVNASSSTTSTTTTSTSTTTISYPPPVIIASKREVLTKDEGNETNSLDIEIETTTLNTDENEADTEIEDVDKRKRNAEELANDNDTGTENKVEETPADDPKPQAGHLLSRVRRVSKAGSSHKIRNDKVEETNSHITQPTPETISEESNEEDYVHP